MLNKVVVENEEVSDLPLDENAGVVDDLDELLEVAGGDGSAVGVVVGRNVVVGAVGTEVRGFESFPLRG